MNFRLLLVGCLLLATGLTAAEPTVLSRLASCLAGTFTSAEQARGDQNFRDATLHVVPIWTDRTDGPWLYAEQALSVAPEHPYRQRIYQLAIRNDGALECRLYDLPDPIAATGAWKDPALLARLTPANLTTSAGCTLVLQELTDGSFKGGTAGKGCVITLSGAAYTTTEITVSAGATSSWERGYNASGAQVWGSLHGGYIFKRIE